MELLKKILTVQLLAALVISQVGYYFFYTIKQYQIKEAVKQQLLCALPESSLQIFAADNKNIVWEEAGKEFNIDGKMYDVAYIKTINNQKYLYCLSDADETILLNNFAKAINHKTSNKYQKDGKDSIKFQTLFSKNIEPLITNCFFINNKKTFSIFQQNTITAIVSVVIPPPKVSLKNT